LALLGYHVPVGIETLQGKFAALAPALTERARDRHLPLHGGAGHPGSELRRDPEPGADTPKRWRAQADGAQASGDPDSSLRWTSKSVRRLAGELTAMGHTVSHRLVADLLNASGYSLQGNRKTREGPSHPDRKKKELVGDFRNAGREWRPKGDPEPVLVHDFLIPEQGKVHPV